MEHSINIGRIKPPQLLRISLRSRLDELLNANSDKRVVFIVGQAAQGKSTRLFLRCRVLLAYVPAEKTWDFCAVFV